MSRTLSDEVVVFRGLRNSHLTEGRPNFRAFLLRAATEERPAEEGLSVSALRENALTSLTGLRGVAALGVGLVRQLCNPDGKPLNLDVVGKPHPSDPGYAWIVGLPVPAHSETIASSSASEAAMALCSIAVYPA